MKHFITFLAILVSAVAIAQKSIEKSVGDFTTLKVYDLIEVELIKSDENKVEITGENSESVLVNNLNGTLKIKMKFKEIFDGANTKVMLYYSKIDVIDANEGTKISSKDEIKQFEIDLRAQEGGQINANLNVSYANVRAVSGGVVEASGFSKNENIALMTGGVFKGEHLKSEISDVSINAAGEAYINSSKEANIAIRAGGDVYIYGNPETVNESKVLGGRIKRME